MLSRTEAMTMNTVNLNITTDRDVRDQAALIFDGLGLDITEAVNIFLMAAIREHTIPFEFEAYIPNSVTASAIEEGRRIARDKSIKGYSTIKDLKAALGV
ncbi:MAG: type II toxin-antitoxin system RelB/DinJ family antitoxin [Synergistaceae bacterium]|nr:type II toxin-antitoxin system RelB/DinJ family antitoxin [Synergistaceae bacterium]MBR1418783.1 type II toxin-antitoxin system RelB/DinJ family antitoxin [Synergistaceae bacterium]MBR1603525.1 type II toxin-antitoxin system RelB/DinJ family antitoxin [Synergistaceae bacterium]